MVEFLTLFLGLVSGAQPVELAVGPQVAAVELILDGESVGVVDAAPWRREVDFGSGLRPHELRAVARDAGGRVRGEARQWINLPQPGAVVSLVLERDARGRPVAAEVNWESRIGAELEAVRVTLDGADLPVPDLRRVVLPELDPRDFHVLEAVLEFGDRLTIRGELTFGGAYSERSVSELTALPIELEEPGRPPDAASLAGRFRTGGERLRVVGVDRGPAQVVFVRDRVAAEAIKKLATIGAGSLKTEGSRQAVIQRFFSAASLGPDEHLRVLYPVAKAAEGHRLSYEQFPVTPALDPASGGVFWNLAGIQILERFSGARRLCDAVAIAGLQAATGNLRRAVVLVLAPGSEDEGGWVGPGAAQSYLRSLGVPFRVWFLGKPGRADPAWESPVGIRSMKDLERAVADLRAALDRQRIVWLEGSHLPDQVQLEPGPDRLRLAR